MEGLEVKGDYSSDIMSKFDQMREDFEPAVSEQAKVTISNLLNRINALSDVEKLLLYLQLPNGAHHEEQQKANPPAFHINNQLEQSQAFTWIVSHLEMDKNTCLRKDEVFEDYEAYCKNHNIKPLNTADFGKVMKRAFPDVKPRRLGMRGQSKYCYGGLRKKMVTATPTLPNILSHEEDIKDKLSDMLAECTSIVVCWAETVLGQGGFVVLRHLAEYLVANRYTDSRSVAAMTLRRDGYKYVDEDGVTLKKFQNNNELLLEALKCADTQTSAKLGRRESPLTSSTEPGSVDTCDGAAAGSNSSVFNTPDTRRSLPSKHSSTTPQGSAHPAQVETMIPPQAKRELLKLPGVFPKGKTRAEAHNVQPLPVPNQLPGAGDIVQGCAASSVQMAKSVYELALNKYSSVSKPVCDSGSVAMAKVACKRRSLPLSSTSSTESDAVNPHLSATPNKRARLSLDSAERNELVGLGSANNCTFGSPSVVHEQRSAFASVNSFNYHRPASPSSYSVLRNSDPQFGSTMPNTAPAPENAQMMPNSSYTAMLLSESRTPYLAAAQNNTPMTSYMPATYAGSQRLGNSPAPQRSRSPSNFSTCRSFSPSTRLSQNMADGQQFNKQLYPHSTSPFEPAHTFNQSCDRDAGERKCFQPILTSIGPSSGANGTSEQYAAASVDPFHSLPYLVGLPNFTNYDVKVSHSDNQSPTSQKPDSTSSSLSVGIGSPQQITDSSGEQQTCSSILQETTLAADQLSSSQVDVNLTSNILSPTSHRERRFEIGTPEEHRVTSTTRESHDKAPQQATKSCPHAGSTASPFSNVNAAAAASSTDSTRVASVIQSCLSILKDLDPEYVTMYEQQQLGFRQRIVGPAPDAPQEVTAIPAMPLTTGCTTPPARPTQMTDVDLKPNVEPASSSEKLRKDELNTPTPPNSNYSSPDSSDLTSGMSTSNNASSFMSSMANSQQLQDFPPTNVATNNNVRKPTLPAYSLNALPHS